MFANLIAAAIGFVSVMLLTRLVEPADYGVYVVAVSLGTIVAAMSFTWLRHAIMRFQSEPGADIRLSALVGYAATIGFLPAILVIMLAVFRVPLTIAITALAFAAAMMLFELGQELLRARQQVRVQALAGVSRTTLSLVLCLTAVWSGFGGIGLIVGMTLGYLLIALASTPSVWQKPLRPFEPATLRTLAIYGVPITLSGFFVAVNVSLDRLVLAALLGPEQAGVYGAIADFVRQCAILPAISASMSIAPIAVAALAKDGDTTIDQGLSDGAELLLAVLLPTVVGLAIAAPEISGVVLGPAYRDAAPGLIPIIGCAYMAHMISQQFVQLSFSLAKKPSFFIYHTGLILAVNLALIFPLVSSFGPRGAAISFLIAEVSGVVVGFIMARRAFPLPLAASRLARVAASVAIMAVTTLAIQRLVGRTDVIGLVIVLATGIASYVAAAYVANVVQIQSLATAITRRHTL